MVWILGVSALLGAVAVACVYVEFFGRAGVPSGRRLEFSANYTVADAMARRARSPQGRPR